MKPRPPATVSGAAVSAADLAAWILAHAHELAQVGAAVQACAIAWLATVAPTPHWLTALGLVQELNAAPEIKGKATCTAAP